MSQSYDFIITGAGAAGLSLAVRLILSGKFSDKKILIIDRDPKTRNDRTWCFWETKPGIFDPLVYRKWDQGWFHGDAQSRLLHFAPYTYKLIRSIDFYNSCISVLRSHAGVQFVNGSVEKIYSEESSASCIVNGNRVTARYIFNSILFDKIQPRPGEHFLLQHFRGWRIKTPVPTFNPAEPVLMDFRVPQDEGSTFVYLLPFSETEALIEYTIFSERLLAKSDYDTGIRNYLQKFYPGIDYIIEEEEEGVIPMTDHRFLRRDGNIIQIGTAGGQTKASTGYTFSFIQKQTGAIINAMEKTGEPFIKEEKGMKRFRFYDSTLLEILQAKKLPGHLIFTRLFTRNQAPKIFKFLDNETSVGEELRILKTLPTMPFLRAALKQF